LLELHAGRLHVLGDLLGTGGADDRGPHVRVLPHPGARQLRQRQAGARRARDRFTLCVTCWGREAPTIAADTFGFCSTQATASCDSDRPTSAAIGCSSWTRVRTSSVRNRLMKFAPPFSSVAREPSGGC